MTQPTQPNSGVTAIIATIGRPELLRRAVRSILNQRFDGDIELIVVFDHIDIDPLDDVEVPPRRALRTIQNTRSPGLAGGRNSGIIAATHDLIAFNDDDDEWMPDKLTKQIALWEANPDARMVGSGMRVQTTGQEHERIPPQILHFADFIDSRVNAIGSCSFLLRKRDLLGELGLVDEQIPTSFGEDYDLLLRASALGPVVCVPEPLVLINWNRASFFSGRWQGIADALRYLLVKHPQISDSPPGRARIEGQVAFALAALGERAGARQWAASAIRHDRRQLRAYAAYGIAARLLPATWLVRAVNRRGRGL